MQSRERLLAAIKGGEIDRVPWSPFLAYYWEHQPKEVQAMGQFAYLKEMGADPLLRGFHQLVKCTFQNCELHEKTAGNERWLTYETPVGRITVKSIYSPDGDTTFVVGHPVETAEDFRVLQYLYENMEIKEDAARFEADFKQYGEEALLLPVIGTQCKTAFQSLVEHWVGTENLAYALCDIPEVVEECLAVMQARDEEAVKIALNSSADGFIFWEDSSTTNISPAMFEKYTKPQIDRWGELIHQNGKLLVHHACGHLKGLLPLIAKSDIDVLESITPSPTGNVTMQETAKALPEHIALIGGLEPVRMLRATTEEIVEDAKVLLRDLAGKRFVLANADSCPPGVAYEKFLAVSKLVREYRG